MLANGLIDGIIPEPLGGAHLDMNLAASILKEVIKKELSNLLQIDSQTRILNRIEKFGQMGVVVE
jgi:acetyl-CoA carboxylase carboxyl transferase subunit alpha